MPGGEANVLGRDARKRWVSGEFWAGEEQPECGGKNDATKWKEPWSFSSPVPNDHP